jgi:hypothetical protein
VTPPPDSAPGPTDAPAPPIHLRGPSLAAWHQTPSPSHQDFSWHVGHRGRKNPVSWAPAQPQVAPSPSCHSPIGKIHAAVISCDGLRLTRAAPTDRHAHQDQCGCGPRAVVTEYRCGERDTAPRCCIHDGLDPQPIGWVATGRSPLLGVGACRSARSARALACKAVLRPTAPPSACDSGPAHSATGQESEARPQEDTNTLAGTEPARRPRRGPEYWSHAPCAGCRMPASSHFGVWPCSGTVSAVPSCPTVHREWGVVMRVRPSTLIGRSRACSCSGWACCPRPPPKQPPLPDDTRWRRNLPSTTT